MYQIEPTHRPASDPVMLGCPTTGTTGCTWAILSGSAVLAEIEQATHRMAAHATLPERRQVQHLVTAYRQILGDLPTHLLVMAVAQVLDTPATTPAEVVSAA